MRDVGVLGWEGGKWELTRTKEIYNKREGGAEMERNISH